jgi:hypothetical protein
VNALAVCQSILESARTGARVPVDFQDAAPVR